jgi:hypothetical protein
MATAPTQDEVKELVKTNISDVSSFITTASVMYDQVFTATDYSDAYGKQIILYLAAHFLAMREEYGGLTGQTAGDGKDVYVQSSLGSTGQGLSLSRYGQQALALDSLGKLSAVGRQKAAFRVY